MRGRTRGRSSCRSCTWRRRSEARAPCQEIVWEGADVDLARLPVQTCWPDDVAPLVTWGLTVTRGPNKSRQNLGIYRQQVLARNKLIMRWLNTRGGALDFRDHALAHPGTPFPIAVAIGADPATILGAVTPVPDTLSEYQFAGLLRGSRTEIVKCITHGLDVPASAEIVLEGFLNPDPNDPTGYETAAEGPFGDHTGYYNEVERFPVFTVERITMRRDPIYHSTYTGKPPDEPSTLGVALNEVFVPLLQKQFPEIVDFYLPPEGCSYRIAVVSMKKQYPGHAKRVMFGVWSFLRQFMYTKIIVVTDDDIDVRDWKEVVWALTTRVDPARDTLIVPQTPIDYLDFASPVRGGGQQDGHRRDQQVAGRDAAEVGTADRDGRGRQGARRRDLERLGNLGAVGRLARPHHLRAMRSAISAIDVRRSSRMMREDPNSGAAKLRIMDAVGRTRAIRSCAGVGATIDLSSRIASVSFDRSSSACAISSALRSAIAACLGSLICRSACVRRARPGRARARPASPRTAADRCAGAR